MSTIGDMSTIDQPLDDTPRDLWGARIGEYPLPHGAFTGRCASCGATIAWTKTAKGRPVPLSLATVERRDGKAYALTHFADCPDAKEWKKVP